MNQAQQLAKMAAKARAAKKAQVVVGVEQVYPALKAKAIAEAKKGEVHLLIGSVTDKVLYDAIVNHQGLDKLREEGFTVTSSKMSDPTEGTQWALDIYWDSGNPAEQVADETPTS